MSDDEKKKFFNAVDTAYKAKSEGRLRGYNENLPGNRPDLIVHNWPEAGPGQKLITDISIISLFAHHSNGSIKPVVGAADSILKEADTRAKAKSAKFGPLATANNFVFRPLILEQSGAMHGQFLDFLVIIAKASAKETLYKEKHMLKHYLRRISVRYHREVSQSIARRSRIVNGRINQRAVIDQNIQIAHELATSRLAFSY
jgi:hypothetical protein